ncbi:hypothetical protein ACQ4M3_09800 [Leptolyngbya sp. AN03gr2]|uniref:hypothetical protein n=1 Tax=Leptolyngbya sp. AN03gr2 TaxID=3423364 RepID=UPI003D31B597
MIFAFATLLVLTLVLTGVPQILYRSQRHRRRLKNQKRLEERELFDQYQIFLNVYALCEGDAQLTLSKCPPENRQQWIQFIERIENGR